jgi:hypothetical protein
MRGATFTFGLGIVLALAAPTPARACGQGYGGYGAALAGLAIGGIVLGAGDLSLTVYDGTAAVDRRHPSAGYGVLETVVAGPQLALGIYALTSNTGGKPYFALYTAWMAFLTAHGLWAIVTAPGSTSAPPDAVTPRPPPEPLPRLQMSLGPTYVPLGQAAQPGFGVVGRF